MWCEFSAQGDARVLYGSRLFAYGKDRKVLMAGLVADWGGVWKFEGCCKSVECLDYCVNDALCDVSDVAVQLPEGAWLIATPEFKYEVE